MKTAEALVGVSRSGSAHGSESVGGQTAQLTLDTSNIALAARHGGLEFCRALHITLGVAQIQRIALWLAAVLFLDQLGMAGFGLAQFRFQTRTGIGVAGALVVVGHPRCARGGGRRGR